MKCKNCLTEFESNNSRQLYCKNSCKTMFNRKKSNIPEPTFLSKKENSNIGNGNVTDKSNDNTNHVTDTKLKQMSSYIEKINLELTELNKRRENLIKETNRIIKSKENKVNTTLLGALIGALIVGESVDKKNKTAGQFFGMIGGATIGKMLESPDLTKREKENLIVINSKVSEVNARIFYLQTFKKTIETDYKRRLLSFTVAQNLKKTTTETKEKGIEVKTAKEIASIQFETIELESSWNSFLGSPEKGFSMLIYGKPGQGKSTTAINFAYSLSKSNKVLYLSSEEGFSQTMKSKLENKQTDTLLIAEPKSKEEVLFIISKHKPKFVFLDSVNHLRIKPEEIEELRKRNPKTSFVLILQATKQGNSKGSSEYEHNVDIVIKVENMILETTKNRYNHLKSTQLSELS